MSWDFLNPPDRELVPPIRIRHCIPAPPRGQLGLPAAWNLSVGGGTLPPLPQTIRKCFSCGGAKGRPTISGASLAAGSTSATSSLVPDPRLLKSPSLLSSCLSVDGELGSWPFLLSSLVLQTAGRMPWGSALCGPPPVTEACPYTPCLQGTPESVVTKETSWAGPEGRDTTGRQAETRPHGNHRPAVPGRMGIERQ